MAEKPIQDYPDNATPGDNDKIFMINAAETQLSWARLADHPDFIALVARVTALENP